MPTAGDNDTVRIKQTKIMDDGDYQKVQASGRKDETYGKGSYGMMRMQNYGMTANPPSGSLGNTVSMSGNPDHAQMGFMEHPKYRPKNLAEGDVMFYSKHNAGENQERTDYMKMTENELTIAHKTKIIIKVGSSTITITADNITIKSGRVDLNP